MTRQPIPESALGLMSVSLEERGLVRTSATGELVVPWADVSAILHSRELSTVCIRDSTRVVLFPRRALATEEDRSALVAELERRSGQKAVELA
jgi:hypothetical protein